MRALFVEDEPNDYVIYIDTVRAEVTRRDGELDLVRTLEEALCRLERNTYEVVILDLNIPLGVDCRDGFEDCDMNGKYLVDYLRDRGPTGTRVVCLTNYARRSRAEMGQLAGVTILAKSSPRHALVKAAFP